MNTSENRWYNFIYVKKMKGHIGLILLSFATSAFLGYSIPHMIKKLFASYERPELFNEVWITLAVIFVLEYINRVVYQLSVTKYVQHLILQVRNYCYLQWLRSYENPSKNRDDRQQTFPLGEVLARIMSDSESIRELMNSGSLGIFVDIVFIASCLIGFLTLNITSGIFLIIVEVVACILLVYVSKYMRQIFKKVRTENGIVSRKMADLTSGLQQAYYFRNYSYASKQCDKVSDRFLRVQLVANVWDAAYYSVAESLFPIMLALLVVIFPHSGITQLAIVAALVDLIQRSIGPIKEIASKVTTIQRAMSGIERVIEFTDHLQQGLLSPIDFVAVNSLESDFNSMDIKIDRFTYDNNEKRNSTRSSFALQNIHFTANRGELIGIVGLSGCGKSTLLNILSGDIIMDEGSLQLNFNSDRPVIFSNKVIKDFHRYREHVSIVSQDSHIFSESLMFNITMRPDAPVEDFRKFWQAACEQIPYLESWGLKAEDQISIGEISSGQKQLLAALRACYLKKTVVLFDEISSSLDSELEEALKMMVLLVQKQSLTIIVAHRIETIINANSVIVLDNGKLVSQGDHQQLLKSSKIYRQFVEQVKK